MNEILNNIKTRRSIRSFTDEKIPKEALEQIVEAGRYAPSAMNRQLCRFTVVQNPAMIENLAAAIGQELNRGSNYNFCALENIFLAAHALGIGSVWINQLKGICDAPAIRAVLNELRLPENHIVLGMAALGYPAEPPKEAVKRADVVEWIL